MSISLYAARPETTRRCASHRAGFPPFALLALAAVTSLSLACGDPPVPVPFNPDPGTTSTPIVEGTWTGDAPPVPAAALPQADPSECFLDFSSFAIAQRDGAAFIMHGLSANRGSIPARVTDDGVSVDVEISDTGTGQTTSIIGDLASTENGARLDGTLTMLISGGTPSDCGPTELTVAASRTSSGLPAPAASLGGAEGAWLLSRSEVESSCDPIQDDQVDLDVQIDVPSAGLATLTITAGGETTEIVADLVDVFFVAEWDLEPNPDTSVQNLTLLQYLAPPLGQDFLVGSTIFQIEDPGGACTGLDGLLGLRPEIP